MPARDRRAAATFSPRRRPRRAHMPSGATARPDGTRRGTFSIHCLATPSSTGTVRRLRVRHEPILAPPAAVGKAHGRNTGVRRWGMGEGDAPAVRFAWRAIGAHGEAAGAERVNEPLRARGASDQAAGGHADGPGTGARRCGPAAAPRSPGGDPSYGSSDSCR